MNLYDSPKGVFWGSKTPLFRILGACSSTKHFVAIKINKIPKTSMLFLTFLHFGDRKRSFSLTFQISIVFFGGCGDLFGGVGLPLVTSGK